MLREEVGNLVTGNYTVFCHQVNCKGVMGAGLAKQIRNEYPEVYRLYKRHCEQGYATIGTILPVVTGDRRMCVNMFAQYSYGRDRMYTNYDAFEKCLNNLLAFLCQRFKGTDKVTVAFPKFIGCGLAGGKWEEILLRLKKFADKLPWDVVIVRLG